MTHTQDPVVLRHRDLERIALEALEVGKTLAETGARCSIVRGGMVRVARGLGAERVHVRVGYASLSITVVKDEVTSARMIELGPPGVNMRLNHDLRALCVRIERGGFTCAEARDARLALVASVRRHPMALEIAAAAVACAAFGRLLGVDWAGVPAILLAGALGQYARRVLHAGGLNAFALTAAVAFLASATAGLAAGASGGGMIDVAMSAAVLMLVPGVPAMNAQTDIMEGFPTLGSARFVTVFMLLLFLTVGVGSARLAIGVETALPDAAVQGAGLPLALGHAVAHQALFGALAAAGFGVLFNFGPLNLLLAGAAGALALAVRTLGLEIGWPLATASFVAAVAVATAVALLNRGWRAMQRAGDTLAAAGCIPMIPGSAAAQWIGGLFSLTASVRPEALEAISVVMAAGLQVVFTIGAIGAGLAIVSSLARRSGFPS